MRDLPVECWQEIFKCALYVPIFFDIDPMGEYGIKALAKLSDDTAYWESERTRNAMRRVCSSWNQQLERYSHRFIITPDVIHGHVPVAALRSAIRILAEECICRACTKDYEEKEKNLAPFFAGLENSTDSRLDAIVDGVSMPWKVMILEEGRISRLQTTAFSLAHRVANVRVAFAEAPQLFNAWSSTRLKIYSCNIFQLPLIQAQQITAFQILIHRNAEYHQWEWPNLRHLNLEIRPSAEWSQLTEWLQKIGPQLHSFIFSGPPHFIPLNPTIWELCSSLEYIGLPPFIRWTAPPVNHPVRALRVGLLNVWARVECFRCQIDHPPLSVFPSMRDLVSSKINTLVFMPSWDLLVDDRPKWMRAALHCLWEQAKIHNISLIDREWRSFEDWVVSELEMYKRSGRHIKRYSIAW